MLCVLTAIYEKVTAKAITTTDKMEINILLF